MADSGTDGIAKDAALPPIAKEPVSTADATMAPAAVPNTSSAAATEPITQPEESLTDVKGDGALKMDEADTLGLQPEKPSQPLPTPASQPVTSEVTATGALAIPNGSAVDLPKPVSVEEIRDQDLPPVAETKDAEMSGALPTGQAANETAQKGSEVPVATTGMEATEMAEVSSAVNDAATEKTDSAAVGEKRKAEDPAPMNGDSAAAPSGIVDEDAPSAEKKQKTNGEAAVMEDVADTAASNGAVPAPRKPGRPKKEKRDSVPSIGRTMRKTRSQGAPDQI